MKKWTIKNLAIVAVSVILVVISLAIVFGSVAGVRSGVRIGSVEITTDEKWSLQYMSFDGKDYRKICVQDDSLDIAVTTNAGKIDIRIINSEGDEIFCESDMQTGRFSIPASGKVTIYIEAEDHEGGFEILY